MQWVFCHVAGSALRFSTEPAYCRSTSDDGFPAMHTVAVLAVYGVIPFDLSIPCEVFGRVRLPCAADEYHVQVCGETTDVRAHGFDIRATSTLEGLAVADTVIVPGVEDPMRPVTDAVVAALRAAYANGARRFDLHRGVHIGTDRTARRKVRNHTLACCRIAGKTLSQGDREPRRSVHRYRSDRDIRRDVSWSRYVFPPFAARPRPSRRSACRPPGSGTARPGGKPGAIHPA